MGGHLTEKIILEQGVPQGDVVSPYVFILMVEILLIKINHTANIEGINFAKSEGRSETFADDTTIYITRTETNQAKLIFGKSNLLFLTTLNHQSYIFLSLKKHLTQTSHNILYDFIPIIHKHVPSLVEAIEFLWDFTIFRDKREQYLNRKHSNRFQK